MKNISACDVRIGHSNFEDPKAIRQLQYLGVPNRTKCPSRIWVSSLNMVHVE